MALWKGIRLGLDGIWCPSKPISPLHLPFHKLENCAMPQGDQFASCSAPFRIWFIALIMPRRARPALICLVQTQKSVARS